jgi:hypothetical protein
MKSLGTETDVIEVKRKKSFEMMRLASQVQVRGDCPLFGCGDGCLMRTR